MRKPRNILALVAIGLIAVILIGYFNYDDLSWSGNKSNYIGLTSAICIVTSMVLSNRVESKRETQE